MKIGVRLNTGTDNWVITHGQTLAKCEQQSAMKGSKIKDVLGHKIVTNTDVTLQIKNQPQGIIISYPQF